MQLYVLECFLARLGRSRFADRFVLKGGVLLAAFGERRPTRDIDFQAQAIDRPGHHRHCRRPALESSDQQLVATLLTSWSRTGSIWSSRSSAFGRTDEVPFEPAASAVIVSLQK